MKRDEKLTNEAAELIGQYVKWGKLERENQRKGIIA